MTRLLVESTNNTARKTKGGKILDCITDAPCFRGVSITSCAQYACQVGEPAGHGFGASFRLQREHHLQRVLCSSKVASQSARGTEIHSRAKLASRPPNAFRHLGEQCEGGEGLSFGLFTIAENDK